MEQNTQHNLEKAKEQLNKLYDKQDDLKEKLKCLYLEMEQLRDDIEAAEIIFMHQYNKLHRYKEWKNIKKH